MTFPFRAKGGIMRHGHVSQRTGHRTDILPDPGWEAVSQRGRAPWLSRLLVHSHPCAFGRGPRLICNDYRVRESWSGRGPRPRNGHPPRRGRN